MNKKIITLPMIVIVLLITAGLCFAETDAKNGRWHTITWGETFLGIASRYNINPEILAQTNNITNWNRIYVGRKLWIPRGEYIEAYVYTVKWGDYLHDIARRFGVSIYEIASLNGIYNLNYIYEGQIIYIPVKKQK
ncbi:MAG: LysM peptidoglycan-binding domain-containing protein [Spirochaetales bacterium]|nr:LysM peptidoglycan-binding domain-containing protein [Spirochaetales bacterium]